MLGLYLVHQALEQAGVVMLYQELYAVQKRHRRVRKGLQPRRPPVQQKRHDLGPPSAGLRVTGYGLRVTGYGLRVTGSGSGSGSGSSEGLRV